MQSLFLFEKNCFEVQALFVLPDILNCNTALFQRMT